MERGKYQPLLRLSCVMLFVVLAGCSILHSDTLPKFEVFFAADNAELTPSTKTIVEQAAAAIKAQHPKSVIISAGGSTIGVALGDARFNVVRDALIADGVSAAVIVQANLPVAKMKDGDIAERRVEIQLVKD
jgi:outer membrane protein OmpA-like peptidoglycan-associated protein